MESERHERRGDVDRRKRDRSRSPPEAVRRRRGRRDSRERDAGRRRSPDRRGREHRDSYERDAGRRRSPDRRGREHRDSYERDAGRRRSLPEADRRRPERDEPREWGPPAQRRRVDGGGEEAAEEPPVEREEPNFEVTGVLAKDNNTVMGVTLKWTEPPDMCRPPQKWRLYVFKGSEVIKEPYHVSRSPAYLFGRERKVADIPMDHPSCSNQHAVLCFRLVNVQVGVDEIDEPIMRRRIRPYIIDLESVNGTFLNGDRIEARRYIELQDRDVLKFGTSTREYVLLLDTED